jgi:hypothetical protein
MLAGLATSIALHSPAPSAEPRAGDAATAGGAAAARDDHGSRGLDQGSPKKKDQASRIRDAVASAFVLPKGVVLNPNQQAAFDDLKRKSEPDLRQALDEVQQTDGAAANRVRSGETLVTSLAKPTT